MGTTGKAVARVLRDEAFDYTAALAAHRASRAAQQASRGIADQDARLEQGMQSIEYKSMAPAISASDAITETAQ